MIIILATSCLTLLHSEQSKFHRVLAVLSAIGLILGDLSSFDLKVLWNKPSSIAKLRSFLTFLMTVCSILVSPVTSREPVKGITFSGGIGIGRVKFDEFSGMALFCDDVDRRYTTISGIQVIMYQDVRAPDKRGIEDNLKIIFLISQQKHML